MKRRGKGVAVTIHSSGLTGGNDPSEAIVRLHADGSVTVNIGSVEMGQGIKTVARQIAAEVLQLDPNLVSVIAGDSDADPMCTGQFASRTTLVCGNAVKKAAEALKYKLLEYAGAKFQTPVEKLIYSDGIITSILEPEKSIKVKDLAAEAFWVAQEALIGIGRHCPTFAPRDNETGKADFFQALQYISCVAEVTVDDETGIVEVEKMYVALEMGTPINPLLLEGQIEGGAGFGIGFGLSEDVLPYYPSIKHMRTSFREYRIPTALDMPHIESILIEKPSSFGPFGAKGCGEIVANVGGPAIVNAVSNALGGVKFYELPLTPERILRALEEQRQKG
ncbi:Nicotinate dehydrogenase medium molybdopterin subunit [Moorella humiferrea]|uniref:xanthine dehydrogenase family protein molybdopterin-binding subunit n=1 Tax=Neomoorella humiferrea TaxID=676965 RepID=UPI0030CC278A